MIIARLLCVTGETVYRNMAVHVRLSMLFVLSAKEAFGIMEDEYSNAPSVLVFSAKMTNSNIRQNVKSLTLKMTNAALAINSASGVVSSVKSASVMITFDEKESNTIETRCSRVRNVALNAEKRKTWR